jgi:Acetoacetate decarboxylase (ADC)
VSAASPLAKQTAYRIQGRDVRLPVEVRDATTSVAFYLVPAAAAQRLVDPTGLRVATILPRRTLCAIGSVDYRDNDLGQYHEIAITFFVRERGERPLPFVGAMLGLLRGSLATYIHRLPVDGEFTCEAGQTIWGFPKFMSDIAITKSGDAETSVLTVDGERVLTQTIRLGGSRKMPERDQTSYALRGGLLYRTRAVMRGSGMGARLRGATLTLGTHPIADELRRLGLPKRPIASTTIAYMSATFYAPTTRAV